MDRSDEGAGEEARAKVVELFKAGAQPAKERRRRRKMSGLHVEITGSNNVIHQHITVLRGQDRKKGDDT